MTITSFMIEEHGCLRDHISRDDNSVVMIEEHGCLRDHTSRDDTCIVDD
jgi:hypothetical protein